MTRLLLAPLLLVLGLLVGCSSEETEDSAVASDSSSTPASDSAQPEVPEGAQLVEGGGVRFAVPEGWTVVASDDMADSADGSAEMKELASRMNISAGQLQELMRSVDLYVMTDESGAEFNDNVNVMSVQEPLPTEEQATQQYDMIGGTMTSFEELQIDGQDAVLLAADVTLQSTGYSVEALGIEMDSGSVLVTVSGGDAATARELMTDVVESAEVL